VTAKLSEVRNNWAVGIPWNNK